MVQLIYVPSHLVRIFFVPSCKCTCNNATGELPTLMDTSKTLGGLSRGKRLEPGPYPKLKMKGGNRLSYFISICFDNFLLILRFQFFSVITKISDLSLEIFLVVDVHLNEMMFSKSQGKSTKLAIRGGLNPGPKPGDQRMMA